MNASPAQASPAPRPSSAPRTVAVVVLVPLIASLALWAFAWPAARTAPRDLPVGVAGPPAAAARAGHQLERRQGAFEVHRYRDEAAARDAIERREVYGAIIATPHGPETLTASAASPVVAQLLERAGQSAGGGSARTTDVVATPDGDPRGAVLGASVLPMALSGVAAGALVVLLGLRGGRAVLALLGGAALVGAAVSAVAGSWLGVLTGNWWAQAGAVALTSLAISASVAGLGAVLGRAGIGVGAALAVLFGNPFSGVTTAPEMLPLPVGFLGQGLPPGAGGTLLRSVAFFGGNAVGAPVVVLTVWAVVGLLLVTVGGLRHGPFAARTESSGNEPDAATGPRGQSGAR